MLHTARVILGGKVEHENVRHVLINAPCSLLYFDLYTTTSVTLCVCIDGVWCGFYLSVEGWKYFTDNGWSPHELLHFQFFAFCSTCLLNNGLLTLWPKVSTQPVCLTTTPMPYSQYISVVWGGDTKSTLSLYWKRKVRRNFKMQFFQ